MRIKALVRCSASLAVLAASAAPAFAQEQPQGETGATAQETPAEGAEGQPAGEEQIVVTGLRRSLQTSQNIKRESDQIVDVVVAEDIGRLPDRTVSEALARVPGVTVEREGAEAGDVFVRGLRDPATTYNGRDIFTAEARSVAPQDFPAGGVAALEVYKSLTAEQIEGNLAGLINVRSRRPFDFRDNQIAGSANMTYADRADDVDFNGNLLLSRRWQIGDGELGFLINGSYTALQYQDSARFVSGDFFGINPDPARPGSFIDNGGNNNASTVRVPVGVGLFQSPARRVRPSVNASIQARITPELTFYIDGLYQGFRRERSDRLLFVPLFGGGATYTNVALRSGARYADSISATGQARPDGYQAATYDETNTYQVAVGAVYDTDRFRLSFDAARTDSQYDLSVFGVDYALTSAPGLDVVFDVPRGDGGVEFGFRGLDTTNLANYVYRGFYDRHLSAQGDDYQVRLDAEIRDLATWLPSFEFGVRYVTRDGAFSEGDRYAPSPTSGPGARPYGSLPLQFGITRDGYRGDIQSVRQLILPTYDSIRSSVGQLRTIAGFSQDRPAANPRVSYNANEISYTGYAQINYAFDAGGVPLDGAIGLRAVRTEFELNGTSVEVRPGNPDRLVPLTIGNEYTDYLPNASIRARLTSQLQLRAAYTQTRTRPGFGQLNPGLIIDPPSGSPIRSARGGNPNLRPVESNNYDVSLEYYFARNGFAAVALFRRDISGFIVNLSTPVEIPGFGTVNVFGPTNSGEGRLQGVEAQFRTFFDFDFVPEWARSFGTELNLTYIDNQLDAPPSFGPNAGDIQVPDVSEFTYNIVGFYERGPLTARVAYNHRSDYAQFFVPNGNGSFSGEFVGDVSRLDASISYQLFENLTIAADVSNILADPFRNFRTIEPGVVYPRDVRYEERVYSIGIRFRM
jgi:TonB-dependent receptor